MNDVSTPASDDVFDRLAELPPPVQTAAVSMLTSLKVSWRCTWTDYHRPTMEMLQASGLFNVRFNEGGSVTVMANGLTAVLRSDPMRCLTLGGAL